MNEKNEFNRSRQYTQRKRKEKTAATSTAGQKKIKRKKKHHKRFVTSWSLKRCQHKIMEIDNADNPRQYKRKSIAHLCMIHFEPNKKNLSGTGKERSGEKTAF
jgi:hypothetical protein